MKLLLRHKKAAKALSPQSNEPYCLQVSDIFCIKETAQYVRYRISVMVEAGKQKQLRQETSRHRSRCIKNYWLMNMINLDSQPNLISLLLVIDSQGLTSMP